MNTIIDFIDNRENLKGIVYITAAIIMILLWTLLLEIQNTHMLKKWRKAEKLRRKLDAAIE